MHLRLRSKSKSDKANNQTKHDQQKNEISTKASIFNSNGSS